MRTLIGLGAVLAVYTSCPARAECTPDRGAPPICLNGTVLAPGMKLAFLQATGSTSLTPAKPGETVSGWRIVEVDLGSILVQRDGHQLRLRLDEMTALVSAPTPFAVHRGALKRNHALEQRGEREPTPRVSAP